MLKKYHRDIISNNSKKNTTIKIRKNNFIQQNLFIGHLFLSNFYYNF